MNAEIQMFNVVHLEALEEAAVRFKELQAEKELRQLQEDRQNHKKPPPYKHIKVHAPTRYTMRLIASDITSPNLVNLLGEQTNWQSADHFGRPFGNSSLQLQSDR